MQTELHFKLQVCLGRQKPYITIDYVNHFQSRDLQQIEYECQSLLSRWIGYRQAPAHHISWTPDVCDKSYREEIWFPLTSNPKSAWGTNGDESSS